MSLRPLNDRIIIKRLESDATTLSGIVIPDSATEKADPDQVLAFGSGRVSDKGRRIEIDGNFGDRVLFGKYASQAIKINDDELFVLREEDAVVIDNQ